MKVRNIAGDEVMIKLENAEIIESRK